MPDISRCCVQISYEQLTLPSRSVKVIGTTWFDGGHYDFLWWTFNTNCGSILHRFRDAATYWSKIANFYSTCICRPPSLEGELVRILEGDDISGKLMMGLSSGDVKPFRHYTGLWTNLSSVNQTVINEKKLVSRDVSATAMRLVRCCYWMCGCIQW